ncbi:MAG: sortase [Clostridia bacterium]|nr:sortase [Clostridia bacterium]
MDDKFNPEKDYRRNSVDLSSFDLTPFKELFEQEDAEKEAAEKARLEKLEKEKADKEAMLRAQKEAELREKQKKEREAAEREAILKARREREEARRAAEKEKAAAEAARRAEEAAKHKEKMEGKQPEKAADNQSLDDFSSILNLKGLKGDSENSIEPVELTEEFFNYKPPMPSPKSAFHSAICAILIIAILAASGLAGYTYFFAGRDKKELSNTEYIGTSPDYQPYKKLEVHYPATKFPQFISDDMKAVYTQNNNSVGWLSIDDTPIDFPIVQYKDNARYLNAYNFYDKGARYGSPFMDFRCNPTALSKNTVIYAHHMNNKLFFGSLDKYENPDFYKNHPYINFQTLSGNCTFKVYAAFYATTETNVDAGFVFDYYNPNMNNENFKGYIELLNQYAIYTTDAGLDSSDKIITLSTCAHVYDDLRKGGVDTRFVVVGRLLRNGEKASKGKESVTEHNDYRRPQLWYDVNQKSNPYTASRKWKAIM